MCIRDRQYAKGQASDAAHDMKNAAKDAAHDVRNNVKAALDVYKRQ